MSILHIGPDGHLNAMRETLAGFEDDLDAAQSRVFIAIQDLNTAYEAYGQELLHVTELRARVKKLADRA